MDDENLNFLPNAIDAPRDIISLEGIGRVSYYSDCSADSTEIPLLLLHSINAAPSAMEVQPLFEHYRASRPVYAVDLPGFGASSRQDREYSSTFFSTAIHRFVSEVIGDQCDVVALSLTSEFIARASLEHQTPLRSLCMISPTGFTEKEMPGARSGDKITGFLRRPLIGTTLFSLLTTRLSIRYFLGLSFDGSAPQKLIDYAVATAKHPAARFAPYSFVGGKLFDNNATENLYLKLDLPVQVLYDRDPNISFEKLPGVVQKRDNWQAVRLTGTKGLPHWTHLEKTTDAMNRFWSVLTETGTGVG